MALETEGKELLPEVIGAGVRSLLGNPASGFYLVARSEWPRWSARCWSPRNGATGGTASFWWIQSVYVRPEWRRQGVYKRLYRHVQELAAKDPAVCGFRLYVERENRRAQATYRALGMNETRYLVFEELKPGVRFYR